MEDLELLTKTIDENNLVSRKDGLHVWANIVRGYGVEKKQVCQYQFGNFCTNEPEAPQKKLRKVDAEYCQACMQAQKNKDLQDFNGECKQELFDVCKVPKEHRSSPFYKWGYILEYMDCLNVEIEYLKQPVLEFLAEIDRAETELSQERGATEKLDKMLSDQIQQTEMIIESAILAEQQKNASLETDNDLLRGQLEKIKREPIHEKNAWLMIEIQQVNQKVADLEKKIEKLETEKQQLTWRLREQATNR
jgi:hypothetical protein